MTDDLIHKPNDPCLGELQDEFKRCTPAATFWDRLTDNERTRYNIWEKQSPDGKKHGTEDDPAKPWEGASDQRVFLADEIINDEVSLACTALWRTLLDVNGVGFEDDGDAAIARQVMTWFIQNVQEEELDREIELSAQFTKTYGWCVLHITWEREVALRSIEITLATLPVSEEMKQLLLDPAQEAESAEFIRSMYSVWVTDAVGTLLEETPELSIAEAKRIGSDLRADGKAMVQVPYVCRNEPSIRALRPWVDVFIPEDVGDLQRSRVYVRWYYRAEELDAKVVTDGWDEEWVEAAKKSKGKKSVWQTSQAANPLSRYESVIEEGNDYIEVVFAYSRRINAQGLPAIYITVFSPHVTKSEHSQQDLVAQHGLLDYWHGKSPFVPVVGEWIARSITSSRGIPEIAGPMQRVEKVEEDSQIDRAALTTLPPRLIPPRIIQDHRNLEYGPAAVVPTQRGEDPRFMTVPARDGVSDSIIVRNRIRADSYFGRLTNEIPAPRAQVRQQFAVGKFLRAWGRAFRQQWALVQQYMPPKEWERVTNTPKPVFGPNDIGRGYDLMLATDVRDMDGEFAVKKLEAVSKYVLPEDAAGVIDRAKLVALKLRAIDPLLAKQLVVNQDQASQALFERVNMELASMFLGNPPRLVENDPTSRQQLMFAQQVIQANPNYMQALQQGGRFAEALQNWADNRMQSVVQEENKQVGRLGVKPMEGAMV